MQIPNLEQSRRRASRHGASRHDGGPALV